MFKKTALLALACMASALTAASAHAFTIQSGDYKMTIDGYANFSTYSADCTGAACDGAAQIAAAKGATGSEDAWGIFSIASIVNTVTNSQYFTRGSDGYIVGALTGVTNFSVDRGAIPGFPNSQRSYATGGTFNFYTSGSNYDPSLSSLNQANVISSVTNLPLWLSLDFIAGVGTDANGSLATYNSFSLNTNDGTGSGSGYLKVTGGAAQIAFGTGTMTTATGVSADASFDMTFGKPTSGDVAKGNWDFRTSSDIAGYSVPEPGSMALAGLGLIGLAALRRRTRA